ncbi:MAG: hypothetical protein ACLTZI_08410 [[Eubacterium] siraeum]
MLCWLCIVQSLWAYTPGVRAGLNVGLPPSPSNDACSQSLTVAARCSDTND